MSNDSPIIDRVICPVEVNGFYEFDLTNPYTMTVQIKLDHEIDSEKLYKAYVDTLAVWPILFDSLAVCDGNLCFVKNDNPIKIHHSKRIVAAGDGVNDGRVCALTYYDNTVTFTAMHTYFDGSSALRVARNTVCNYLKQYYGKDFKVDNLLKPGDGDKEENYNFYALNQDILKTPYERKEIMWCQKDCFMVDKTKVKGDPTMKLTRVKVPSAQFMSYCKSIGANPSVMLFILFAKAVYKLNPDMDLPFTSLLTADIRKAFGLDMAIMAQATAFMMGVTKDELINTPLPELTKKLRAVLTEQRSKDYLLSRVADIYQAIQFLPDDYTFRLSYFGKIDYGECTQFIKDFRVYISGYDLVHAFEINDNFYFDIFFNEVAVEYAGAVVDLLNEVGVQAKTVLTDKVLEPNIREFD